MVTQPQAPTLRCTLNLRQGSIILAGDLQHLDLCPPESQNLYIVISHDCDIAATPDKEPCVEVISCFIHNGEASETYGKNVRLLHLPIKHNGQLVHVNLEPRHKRVIDKNDLNDVSFCESFVLEQNSLKLLQTWLAARYRRHAFPESLALRLNQIENEINKFGKKSASSVGVIAIYIQIDPANDELEQEDYYEIFFRVIYDSDSPSGQINADALALKIQSAVEKANQKGANIHAPDGEILAVSDMEFSLKDSMSWVQWRFEHLSFRGDQIGGMIEP